MNHHNMFNYIRRIDRRLMLLKAGAIPSAGYEG